MSDRTAARRYRACYVLGIVLGILLAGGPLPASAPDEGGVAPEGWLETVTGQIRVAEYHFSIRDDGSLSAPNRAQGLRSFLSAEGLRVEPRGEVETPWELRLRLTGLRRGENLQPFAELQLHSDENRVELTRGGLVEWYVNDERGLEQGFTLHAPPDGERDRPVVLEMELGGNLLAFPSSDGQDVMFKDPKGRPALRYRSLIVVDATGARLAARIEVRPSALQIAFEDREAVYPVEVDPILTTPGWTVEGGPGDRLGVSVAAAGDVNGDGYGDVIVGADGYDNGEVDEGAAYLYLGAPSGPSTSALWTGESDLSGAQFGFAVAAAGDVNGDGFGDIVVGAMEYVWGRAFVYHGSASGPSATPDWFDDGDMTHRYFGGSVSGAGDVNGDGYDDVIVGTRGVSPGPVGLARVYLGSVSGLSGTPVWSDSIPSTRFGWSVSGAGDVNADGYDDIAVGEIDYSNGESAEGRVYVYHGSMSGPSPTPDWTAENNLADANFGFWVDRAGDVNGDGYGDLVAGAPHFAAYPGHAYVYHGSASGLSATPAWDVTSPLQSWFGYSVKGGADMNGDGYGDVVVGARTGAFVYAGSSSGLSTTPLWSEDGIASGASVEYGRTVGAADVNGDGFSDVLVGDWVRAYLYYGTASGPSASEDWFLTGGPQDEFGVSVASAGDVNGDGHSDLIVGAPFFDSGELDEGVAFVYHGTAIGPTLTPDWTGEADIADAAFGQTVASAGDVNGDGYGDVIVGAPGTDNPEASEGAAYVFHGSSGGLSMISAWSVEPDVADTAFGTSVSSAGDVNGDGFGDVIVGGEIVDCTAGIDCGQAWVYRGSGAGLSTTASWTVAPDEAAARYGHRVSGAGDVNGDGFDDVVVGARYYTNDQNEEGGAFVYHGSSGGLSTTAAWSMEGNLADAQAGIDVASAGDPNGDGYGDVGIGVRLTDNANMGGRALVYYGSSLGLSAAPDWSFEPDQVNELVLRARTAGDLNGDGYGDLAVASSQRVFAFLGSPSGLSTAAAWSYTDGSARSPADVAAGGDLTGDAFGDLVVSFGETLVPSTPSRVQVFFGNAGGGKRIRPRQWRVDNTAPIGPGGISDSPDSFRVRAWGHDPTGKGVDMRLEVEVKPVGQPFDGSGTFISSPTNTPGPPYTVFTKVVSGGLTPGTRYRWRARTRTTSQSAPYSRWFGLPHNGLSEIDFRTASTTLPYVASISPGHGDQKVSLSTNVTVQFSEPIDPLTVTGATFRLLDESMTPIAASRTVVGSTSASLDPDAALATDTTYTVELTAGVQTSGGAESLLPWTGTFTTEAVATPSTPLPLVSEAAPGPAAEAHAGAAVAAAGDLDGDGIRDFLVGTPGLNVSGVVEAGGAAVYLGSGLGSERTAPDIIFQGVGAHDRAGASVAGDFDFNGDGFPDILIGAPQVNDSGSDDSVAGCNDGDPCGAGKVYLIYFDPTDSALYPNIGNPAIADTLDLSLVGSTIPGVTFTGAAFGDRAGFSVDGGGRVNAGAGQDIVIGSPGADPPLRTDAGHAYVIFDDPLLSGTIDLGRVSNGQGDEIAGVLYRGEASGDALGFAVSFPGHVIGSAADDLALGAPLADPDTGGPVPLTLQPDGGIVYILEGGGLVQGTIIETVDVGGGGTVNGGQVQGDQAGMQLGYAIDGGGDNLLDGETDLLIGAPYYDSQTTTDGGLVLQLGSTTTLGTIIETVDVGGGGTNGAIYEGEASGDLLGYSVEGLGDVTGNGLDDIAFGAPLADPEGVTEAGTTYLVEGRAVTPLTQGTIDAAEIGDTLPGDQLAGTEEGEHSGWSIAGTGDISGDLANDWVIGAPDKDVDGVGEDAGQVYLVLDSTLSVSDVDGDGVSDALDCSMFDSDAASHPGSVTDLQLAHDGLTGITTISWSPSASAGNSVTRYDVIRSFSPDEFTAGAACVEWDDTTDTSALDVFALPSGVAAYYLVRAENDCPDGAGSIGTDENGQPRQAVTCPHPADADDDGIGDAEDICPLDPDPAQTDGDGDGHGDACDNCPADPNPGQEDTDSDGIGDVCEPVCGDGDVEGNEECDDVGESATCDADCTFVVCGDSTVNSTAGEDCDEGGGESATCDDDCTIVECGDGNLNEAAGETCDDGNTTPGDGCSATCTVEGGGCTVTNTSDSGPGSLRQAISDATPGSTICTDVTGTIILTSGTLTVNKDLAILGSGADVLTVNASGGYGFSISSGNDVSISDFSVVNGGPGISVVGMLTLTSSTISGSSAGVTNSGTTTISSSTISGNYYYGVSSQGGSVTIRSSTISGNNFYGVYASGAVINLESSTLGSNGYYAVMSGSGGTVSLTNTILASTANCGGSGSIISGGHNLAGDGSCTASLTQPTDQNSVDPQIGALADNGGPTLTHALAPTSPAIDVGSCPAETEDQRGQPRPVDDPAVTDGPAGFCDIGAYERTP